MFKRNKKGAIELSVGTIVVIVIAMSMLMLGLVLVRNIFTGATYNIDQLNEGVESEINQLFSDEDQKMVIYLPRGNVVDIDQGEDYGVGFSIRNTEKGVSETSTFAYNVEAVSIESGCSLTIDQANSFIRLRGSGENELSPGSDPWVNVVTLRPSETAPPCLIAYDIIVKKNGQSYDIAGFDVQVE